MTGDGATKDQYGTTDGDVACINLNAQIEGLATGVSGFLGAGTEPPLDNPLFVLRVAALIDLLGLRGHIFGLIEDYERASKLGQMLVQTNPGSGTALRARARTLETLHRFAEAIEDLDIAENMGVSKRELLSERVGILLALGRYEKAQSIMLDTGELQDNTTVTSLLAVMHAESGRLAKADGLFKEAQRCYRGTSPFPIAQIDFRRGVMWHHEGAFDKAQLCFEDALRLIPRYAPALGHLAEVEINLGNPQAAVSRLRPLTDTSDDPEYAATLATALKACDQQSEADTWRERAAIRYDELVIRHPEAYLDHASSFWLTEGDDPERAVEFALQNLKFNKTFRARAMYERAASEHATRAGRSGHAFTN